MGRCTQTLEEPLRWEPAILGLGEVAGVAFCLLGAGVSVRPLTLLLLQFPALRGLCASELSLKELRRKQVPGTHLEPIPQEQG